MSIHIWLLTPWVSSSLSLIVAEPINFLKTRFLHSDMPSNLVIDI
jgi:hypothetical protein